MKRLILWISIFFASSCTYQDGWVLNEEDLFFFKVSFPDQIVDFRDIPDFVSADEVVFGILDEDLSLAFIWPVVDSTWEVLVEGWPLEVLEIYHEVEIGGSKRSAKIIVYDLAFSSEKLTSISTPGERDIFIDQSSLTYSSVTIWQAKITGKVKSVDQITTNTNPLLPDVSIQDPVEIDVFLKLANTKFN